MSCALCLATGRARRPSRWLEPPPASPSEAMPRIPRCSQRIRPCNDSTGFSIQVANLFDALTGVVSCRLPGPTPAQAIGRAGGGLSFFQASRHEAFRVASCRAAPRKARFIVPRPPRARPSRKAAEPEAARPHPRRIARMRCLQVAAAVSSGHTVVGTGIDACGDPHRPGIRPTWVAEAGISAFFVRFNRPIRRLACAFVCNGLATGKSAR